MRVLYHSQPSMRSYRTNKWLLGEDSQLTKMGHWVDNLPDTWKWQWVIPRLHDLCDSRPAQDRVNVEYIEIGWAPNVLLDRHHFNMPEMLAIFEEMKWQQILPDVALIETIEHVPAYRAMQKWLGIDFPIVGMIGLYDDRDDGFYFRQLAGYAACDKVIFPLQAIKGLWLHRAGGDADKAEVVPAIFSPKEITKVSTQHLFTHTRTAPVVFFISRLSDNERTRYLEFFNACRDLWDSGNEFQVWVANPNGAQTDGWVRSQGNAKNITHVGPFPRSRYIELLWEADIVPVLYPLDRNYSVGALEAAAADCLIAIPDAGQDVRACLESALRQAKGDSFPSPLNDWKQWATWHSVEEHNDQIIEILGKVTK